MALNLRENKLRHTVTVNPRLLLKLKQAVSTGCIHPHLLIYLPIRSIIRLHQHVLVIIFFQPLQLREVNKSFHWIEKQMDC